MSEEQRQTLRDYLAELREYAATHDLEWWERRLIDRLELIGSLEREQRLPAWLEFDKGHELFSALIQWDAFDLGALIGRAILLPREEGENFADPESAWIVASIGLGMGLPGQLALRRRRGGTFKLNTAEQAEMYGVWKRGKRTQPELADDFGVSTATVARVIKRYKAKEQRLASQES